MKNNLTSKFNIALAFITCLSFILLNLSCNKEDDSMDPSDGATNQTVDDTLYSQSVLYDYPLRIFIPKEYETDKNLPIVYLLDGLLPSPLDNVIFYDEVVGSMQNIGLKAILVAVGDRTGVDREIDFLAQGCLGTEEGFNNFLSFLTQELVPYIDNKYESDHSKRTLIGHSHAGNFAINAFIREAPNNIIFHGYVSVDPSECDNAILEGHIDNMDFPDNANIKFHLSQAQFDVEAVYNLLNEKDFPWLYLDFEDYPNENHISVTRPSIRKGLKFIYGI